MPTIPQSPTAHDDGAKPHSPWLVFAACLMPVIAPILMHIPVYIAHPQTTITVLASILTAVAGTATTVLLTLILLDPESRKTITSLRHLLLLVSSIATTGGILGISRNAIF